MSLLSDLNAHGMTLCQQQQFDRAESFFRHALTLDPNYKEAATNLGVVLMLKNDFAAAATVLAYAGSPQAQLAQGIQYAHNGDIDNAVRVLREYIKHDPTNVQAHTILLETIYFDERYEADVIATYDALTALGMPVTMERAYFEIMCGLPQGWQHFEQCYERRSEISDNILIMAQQNPLWFCQIHGKKWQGQSTGHLLISTEQGIGDNIQFLRFIPLAAQRCKKLSVVLPVELRPLARQSFPHVDFQDVWPHDFDHYCMIMSLAHLLNLTQAIPPPPYICIDNQQGEFPTIGLVWNGNRNNPQDHMRSIPVSFIQRLLDVPARFVSLQHPCEDSPVEKVLPSSPTWIDTCQAIAVVDLVISVDTAVAHLAGALNKPVWLMNRFNTDWRWMRRRSDTPWYPSMRIFRQPTFGDWETVIADVKTALREFIQGGKIEHRPPDLPGQ